MLFILFSTFFAVKRNVNLLVISVSSISLAAFPSITGRLYKKTYLSALENSFFLNLGVLAAGTLYIRLVGGSQEALVTTSVGTAFIQYCGITASHAYCFAIVPVAKKCSDFIKSRAENQANRVELEPLLNIDGSDSDSEIDIKPNPATTHSEVCLSELRREAEMNLLPLLELYTEETSPPAHKGTGCRVSTPFS